MVKRRQYVYQKNFPLVRLPENAKTHDYLRIVADNLICIYLDLNDIPFFDWTTNCFESRLCEEDYAKKFVDFLQFIESHTKRNQSDKYVHCPSCIYTSNNTLQYHFLLGTLSHGPFCESKIYIDFLRYWGKIIDNFLASESDYLGRQQKNGQSVKH